LSLDDGLIYLGKECNFAKGMAYVALSRFKSIDGVHITHLEPWIIQCSALAFAEMSRLRATILPAGQNQKQQEKCNQLPRRYNCTEAFTRSKKTTGKQMRRENQKQLRNAVSQAEPEMGATKLTTAVVFERKSQENICYANSGLSALLHLPYFKAAVRQSAPGVLLASTRFLCGKIYPLYTALGAVIPLDTQEQFLCLASQQRYTIP